MQVVPGSSVHFEQYLVLLQGFCPEVRGMIAFDQEQGCVWRGGADQLDLDQVVKQLASFHQGDGDNAQLTLGDSVNLELIKLKNAHGEVALTLCFEVTDKICAGFGCEQEYQPVK